MRKIAVLDKDTIDKIAAGEVVERPSSVVKELVENAIDAQATAITVEIKDGGKKLIRITDNGGGMEKDQVPLAFLRHATSKIEKVEDLEHIVSLGFRGEALSSIAAVSQVELITKPHTAMSGVRYVIEGGEEKAFDEIGAPDGTTFLVHNLFYNVPARSKFLKSSVTEAGYVSSLMEQMALSHPEVSFKYIQNGQVKLHTSGNYNTKDVIYHIYGREIAKEILEVNFQNDFMKIEGFAGKPVISRGNRYFENYYINGRYVKDKIVTKAIEDAYKGFVMKHKFPFVSLQITMEGNDLDVNVHPAKMEVRFSRGMEVYQAIYRALMDTLYAGEMIPEVDFGTEKREKSPKETVKKNQIPEAFENRRRKEMLGEFSSAFSLAEEKLFEKRTEKPDMIKEPLEKQPKTAAFSETKEGISERSVPEIKVSKIPAPEKKAWETSVPKTEDVKPLVSKQLSGTGYADVMKPDRKELFKEVPPSPEESRQMELFSDKLLSEKARESHRLIGQLFSTYWLMEYEDKLYIVDQHAAHEKVYYERFVKQFREKTIHSQYISPPLIVTLTPSQENLLTANQKYFQQFGFEIEPFGGKEYCISAVPTEVYGLTQEGIFLEMLDHLSEDTGGKALEIFAGRLATMACKAAVKGNQKLSFAEAQKLVDELMTLENPYHCPHGRPTIISMTKTELEKKFKRIL